MKIFYQLTVRQRDLLDAVSREGKTSTKFTINFSLNGFRDHNATGTSIPEQHERGLSWFNFLDEPSVRVASVRLDDGGCYKNAKCRVCLRLVLGLGLRC